MAKIQIELRQVLELIVLGIDYKNYEAVKILALEIIEQLKEKEEEDELHR